MPPSFLSIFTLILIIIRILLDRSLEERDHVLLTVNFTGSNGNIRRVAFLPPIRISRRTIDYIKFILANMVKPRLY